MDFCAAALTAKAIKAALVIEKVCPFQLQGGFLNDLTRAGESTSLG